GKLFHERGRAMKVAGILLILAAIIILLGYGFYEIMLTADIPFWIRTGLTLLAVGLLLALIALLRERADDRKREAEENDHS
ncbi:MAG: hypothetical protein WBK69_07100, partial [bacterium]